jgi:hypothetical protein
VLETSFFDVAMEFLDIERHAIFGEVHEFIYICIKISIFSQGIGMCRKKWNKDFRLYILSKVC